LKRRRNQGAWRGGSDPGKKALQGLPRASSTEAGFEEKGERKRGGKVGEHKIRWLYASTTVAQTIGGPSGKSRRGVRPSSQNTAPTLGGGHQRGRGKGGKIKKVY